MWPHVPWSGETGLIQAFERNTVESVTTTNCFQSGKPETVCIQGKTGGLALSSVLRPFKVYFSLAPGDRQMLVTRVEVDGELWYPELGSSDEFMLMGLAVQYPLILNESEFGKFIEKATIPQILNSFMYINAASLKGKAGAELKQLHQSMWMQEIIGRLTRHEHLWVRHAANYYLIKYGDFSGKRKSE